MPLAPGLGRVKVNFDDEGARAMALRKKKTVRDTFEDRLNDILTQVADRAPDVRDRILSSLESGISEIRSQVAEHGPEVAAKAKQVAKDGASEVRDRYPAVRDSLLERVPELSQESYDKLPSSVADRLPDEVKPKKKRRLRKIAFLGLVVAAGAAAFSALRKNNGGPTATPTPYPSPTPNPNVKQTPPPPPVTTEADDRPVSEPDVTGPDTKGGPTADGEAGGNGSAKHLADQESPTTAADVVNEDKKS